MTASLPTVHWVNFVSRLKLARLLKTCIQHQQMMHLQQFSSAPFLQSASSDPAAEHFSKTTSGRHPPSYRHSAAGNCSLLHAWRRPSGVQHGVFVDVVVVCWWTWAHYLSQQLRSQTTARSLGHLGLVQPNFRNQILFTTGSGNDASMPRP